jgi:micrococcal nuclease
MPSTAYPTDRTARFVASAVGALPFALLIAVLLFVLFFGSAGVAAARETTGEMPKGIRAGDGEVSIDGGEVYAGDGCAKAGGVVAGDCDEKGGIDRETTSPGTPSPESTAAETTSQENTVIAEETTGLTPTSPETTVTEETDPQRQENLCPAQPSGEAAEATVARAVDGDTLELAEEVGGADRVRLIGVDSPELEGEGGDPEPYAEEAAAFTAEALEGEEILLEVGEEATDDYGRLLAHVWTVQEEGFVGGLKRVVGMGGPELFDRTLLEEGYAEVLTVEPNDLYAGCFEAAEQVARDKGAGIWSTGGDSSDTQYEEETGPEATTEQALSEGTAREETVFHEETDERAPLDGTTEQSSPGSASPEAGTHADDLEGETVEGEPVAGDQYEHRAASPTTRRAASPPSPAAEPDIAETFAAQPSGLPTRELPTGSVAVLPETGGAGPLPLLIGACCVAGGVLSLIVASHALGRRKLRPGGR